MIKFKEIRLAKIAAKLNSAVFREAHRNNHAVTENKFSVMPKPNEFKGVNPNYTKK